jgi:spore germination protein
MYGVNADKIVTVNRLNDLPNLIVGQALVIPSTETSYRVRPGDSLWSIANKFNVSVDSIATLNNLTPNSMVYPGTVLRIPEKSKNYGAIETNGFIQPSTTEKEDAIINEAGPYLTYISPFSYRLNEDASLIPIKDENIIDTSRKFRVAPMMSVTNLSLQNFNTALINNIITNDQLQQTLINNIETTMKAKGYYGVIVDFERIAPENRQRYNDFLRKLTDQLHKQNYVVATALAPKTYDVTVGAWHGAHDYKAHGEIVDFVIIMTYEWGWSGGPPMAVAPINEVRKVINYALSVIPPKKIMMGMPLYGYDWALPYTPGGEFAKSVGMQEALQLAAKYKAIIKYDEMSQSPYFNYFDENKISHVVWFEDARSVMAKYLLVSKYGLRGVSYWVLSKPFPQNWEVLDNMFKITKVVP